MLILVIIVSLAFQVFVFCWKSLLKKLNIIDPPSQLVEPTKKASKRKTEADKLAESAGAKNKDMAFAAIAEVCNSNYVHHTNILF
jgi:hypothetical protein